MSSFPLESLLVDTTETSDIVEAERLLSTGNWVIYEIERSETTVIYYLGELVSLLI